MTTLGHERRAGRGPHRLPRAASPAWLLQLPTRDLQRVPGAPPAGSGGLRHCERCLWAEARVLCWTGAWHHHQQGQTKSSSLSPVRAAVELTVERGAPCGCAAKQTLPSAATPAEGRAPGATWATPRGRGHGPFASGRSNSALPPPTSRARYPHEKGTLVGERLPLSSDAIKAGVSHGKSNALAA